MRALLVGSVLLAMSAGSALADEDATRANYVMVGCRYLLENNNDHPFLNGLCVGHVSQALLVMKILKFACPSPQVTVGQAIRVVVQYIDARPSRLDEYFGGLTMEAIKAAWPCR